MAWRSAAAALLLVLLTAVFGPLAMAQAGSNPLPACCRDAQSCSQHLHHAAQQANGSYHLAAMQQRCPCTPLAPASVAADGAPSAATAQADFVLETQSARVLPCAPSSQWLDYPADGTRGPPRVA